MPWCTLRYCHRVSPLLSDQSRIIPESLRWLLSKGKVKRAEVVARSYIGYNSLKLDPASLRHEMESVSRDLVSRQDARRPPDITDILRVSVLRKRAVILFFVWFSVSICYYGISYFVPNLFGDRHLNFVLGKDIKIKTLEDRGSSASTFIADFTVPPNI